MKTLERVKPSTMVALRLRLRKRREERKEEAEKEWQMLWLPLLESMGEPYALHVYNELSSYYSGVRDFYSLSNLTQSTYTLVRTYKNANEYRPFRGPLAIPPAVAQVYYEDPTARPYHDCSHCGYALPARHFDVCPFDGAKVGYSAYYMAHQPASSPVAAAVEEAAADEEIEEILNPSVFDASGWGNS